MTGRRLAWILGVAALMLAALLVLRDRPDVAEAGETLELGTRVGPDVSYLRIDRPDGSTLELNRRDEGWTINGYPAVDSLASATTAGLDTLAPGRLVSRSATNHARLGLTSDSAVRVRVGPAGTPVADFLVGASGSDGRFVRLPDGANSYVLPGAVMDPLVGEEADWRDFTIADIDTAAVRRIEIVRRRLPGAVLTRSETASSGWNVDGAPADTAVMRLYLRILSRLEATGFPADSFVFAADFENPVATVNLYTTAEGGEGIAPVPEVSLLFATSPGHPDVFVRRADDPIVYAIDAERANALTTPAGGFRAR